MGLVIIAVAAGLSLLILLMAWVNWYRKCPSDRIMVIYGRTGLSDGHQKPALCIHGGAKFVWPVFQDYGYISLRPMQIEVNLNNALCKQNIRINVPSVFTVGVSTKPEIMGNAAERLLGQPPEAIAELAKDIIFGQLRLVIASMTIEAINADRETFLRAVEDNVTEELKKIGLDLLNVNVTDITDESGYIEAIGKRAAAEAINRAKIDVAEEERKGSIGAAEAEKQKRVAVSMANAEASAGEADADRDRRIKVRQAEAAAVTGEADADRDQRIAVKQADAAATQGENLSAIEIAKSNAVRAEQEAEAFRKAQAARKVAEAQIEQSRFAAEAEAQKARALMEEERQRADVIVQAQIERQKIEIAAEAEAEKRRREAKGEADAIFARLDAEARGNFAILDSKARGYREIVEACRDADAAGKLLLIEKLQDIVALQTEAIKNIRIDKVTVWDTGSRKDGRTSTADFLSGMVQSLPPLQSVAKMAGVELPDYLGKVQAQDETPAQKSEE